MLYPYYVPYIPTMCQQSFKGQGFNILYHPPTPASQYLNLGSGRFRSSFTDGIWRIRGSQYLPKDILLAKAQCPDASITVSALGKYLGAACFTRLLMQGEPLLLDLPGFPSAEDSSIGNSSLTPCHLLPHPFLPHEDMAGKSKSVSRGPSPDRVVSRCWTSQLSGSCREYQATA